ncbi:MAG: flagellar motor protein MotB [Rhodospirillaceae bacterium]|nr:flagellar motor protein MotB [Rhodospirillaceae bacterium]
MPPKQPAQEPQDESWMTTYADAITLLMAFFVMLLNFSKIDIPAYEEAAAGIKNSIGMGEKDANPVETMKKDIQDLVYEMQADKVVDVQVDDKGITIELASSAFYKPGTAEFRDEAIPVLQQIGTLMLAPRYMAYIIEIEGHTDDDPIHTPMYPSNWELSAGRATRIVRFFIQMGMDFRRMKAIGFAETRPKAPNRDKDGNPIPDNQMENRRVVMSIYPMSLQDRALLFKDATYGLVEQVQGSKAEKAKEAKQNPGTLTGLPKEESQQ